MELTPPGPTFRDVAELERLSEPTGIIVVENGLYIVRYMLNASVWTVAFVFLGRDRRWAKPNSAEVDDRNKRDPA